MRNEAARVRLIDSQNASRLEVCPHSNPWDLVRQLELISVDVRPNLGERDVADAIRFDI